MKIVHALPGRLRLEFPELFRNPGLASLLEERLTLLKGIIQVQANYRTGRILVIYSPHRLTGIKIEELVRQSLSLPYSRPLPTRAAKKQKNEEELKAFELESLPIAQQVFFAGASGALLLYSSLKRKLRPDTHSGGGSWVFAFDSAVTVLTGYPVFRTALEHLLKKGRLSSELLAGMASLSSLALQDSRMGLFVVWLVYLSTLLRTLAMEHARDRIRELLEIKKPVARVQTPAGPVLVPGDRVAAGALVIVKKGERLTVDGRVAIGAGLVNQCPVKGDTALARVSTEDPVYAGTKVLDGELYVKAERTGEETYLGRAIQLLERRKLHHLFFNSKVVRLMNKISLFSLAASASVYLVTGDVRRAIAILVVGTPGAAGLASSISLETAAGRAAGRGILVKDARHLEKMGSADTVLFDKTALLSPESKSGPEAVEMLREAGIPHIGLLTGEPGKLNMDTVNRLKLTEHWPDCRLRDKLDVIRQLQKQGRVVAVVGDRNSDVQSLSMADVGITMSRATDLDLESADIIIADNDPRQVARLNLLARQSLKVAGQNTTLSVGVNLLGLGLGVLNLLSPLPMALLQNISTLGILFNSGRLLLPVRSDVSRRKLAAEAAVTVETGCLVNEAAKEDACRALRGIHAPKDAVMPSIPGEKTLSSPTDENQGNETTRQLIIPEAISVTFRVNGQRGLTTSEAEKRLLHYGYNILPRYPRPSVTEIFFDQLKNYMSRVLLGIAGISLLLGRQSNALMSAGVLLANTVLAVLQERRTENSLQLLNGLAAPRARVIRDGGEMELPAKNLVPGDIIVIEAGDKVPADARVLDSWRLTVEEAPLTGESAPVLKQNNSSERSGMLFMGTGVVGGRAQAMVVRTGAGTEMGRIAGIIGYTGPLQTPLHKRLDEMGVTLVRCGAAVSGVALLAGLWHGENPGNIIVNATSLAVSVIPDGLAPIITVSMALGALRMLKRRVIVRQFQAVDTLGCISVICCDKTGTLTKNQMTVREVFCSGQHWVINGKGYLPVGEGNSEPDLDSIRNVFQIACLCNNAGFSRNGKWVAAGDSTERALLEAAMRTGIWRKDMADGFTRIDEIPFNPETKRMTVICRDSEGARWSFVKGAPDVLMESCISIRRKGRVEALSQLEKKEAFMMAREMSRHALRVLALAYKPLAEVDTPEEGLVFSGLLGIFDPPRAEAKTTLGFLRRAGVEAIMLTGDQSDTALAVAKEIGLADEKSKVLTGAEIDSLTDEELAGVVRHVRIYARVSPRNKLRLIKTLKDQGLVVAMLGDGVNDAPAIKEAHLGIAMGRSGVAVTREVAAVTLADDNIATVPEAIKEGRTVYANIRKCMRYLIATNIGDGIVILTAALLGRPMPLHPLQLLWVNLSSDPLISWALANDPPVPGAIDKPSRRPGESIFSGGLGRKIFTRSFFLGMSALMVYNGSLSRGENLALTRTKTMAALGLGRLFYLFDCRREKGGPQGKPVVNKGITAGGGLILATLLGAVYIPFLRSILKTVPLSPGQWSLMLAWSGLSLLADAGLNFLLEPGELKIEPRDKKPY